MVTMATLATWVPCVPYSILHLAVNCASLVAHIQYRLSCHMPNRHSGEVYV